MPESPPGFASTASSSPSPSASPWGPASPSLGAPCSISPGLRSPGASRNTWGSQEAPKTALGYASRLSRNPHKGPVGVPEERENAISFAAKSARLLQGLQQQVQQLQQHEEQEREEGEGVVVHTGAGISTSAGIPDFRGPSGVWTLEQRGQTLADVEASIVQVAFGRQRRPVVPFHLALPTPTHLILQALIQEQQLLLPRPNQQDEGAPKCKHEEEHKQRQQIGPPEASASSESPRSDGEGPPPRGPRGPLPSPGPPEKGEPAKGRATARVRLIDYIITQNVDALHARCGAPLSRLGEVHGNMFVERCDNCARRFLRDYALPTLSFRPTGRLCGLCSFPPSGVCTDVLLDWFDAYEPHFLSAALFFSRATPFHICLGTSLQIQPACHFPAKERKSGSTISIVNLQQTPLDKEALVCLHAPVDNVLQEVAKGLGLVPGWGWSKNSKHKGGRWGSLGSCDTRGFESDPVPFRFGEFIRTSLLFVLRIPTHALSPDTQQHQVQFQHHEQQEPQHKHEKPHQQQQQHQQQQLQEYQEQQHTQEQQYHQEEEELNQADQMQHPTEHLQQQLPCGVQGLGDPWADQLAWLPHRVSPEASGAASAAATELAATESNCRTLQEDCWAADPPQIFLVAASCGNSLELVHSNNGDNCYKNSKCNNTAQIDCLDSLRGIWKVTINRGMDADIWQLMLGCTPNTHASSLPPSILPPAAASSSPIGTAGETDIWGSASSLPSSLVSLVPPYEPRWPQGRAILRSRLVGSLSPHRCSAAADATPEDTQADAGRERVLESSEAREWALPTTLISLYRLQGAAALPSGDALHAAVVQQQRPKRAHRASPSVSPLGAPQSPAEGPPTTPAAAPDAAVATSVCTLETSSIKGSNSGGSSGVERRYPLRKSRQSGLPTPQVPAKRRRGGGSGGVQRSGLRRPLSAVRVPAVGLPTEEEEAGLPYVPLQLARGFRQQQQKQQHEVVQDAAAPVACPSCNSCLCGAPLLLLAADWDLGSLVTAVPPEIKPAKRYVRVIQRASKQQQLQQPQETVPERVDRLARLLLQQLYSSNSRMNTMNGENEGTRVMAGAFIWNALRGLPLWTLHYLQDLLECM